MVPSADGQPLTDYDVALAIRDGKAPSPTQYGDFWLFDVRVTGTGAAYRDKIDEYGIRDPDLWTSEEFVQRCNGLAVIFEHPPTSGLNSEEFRERSIGSIVLPYVKQTDRGPEVWGIAKIFDADAAALMQTTHRSTSPGVTPPKGSMPIELENGCKVLDEGLPQVLDHLAVCEAGVWDKEGPPEGIRLDSLTGKGELVAEKTREEELEAELADAKRRADSAEKERDDARAKLDEQARADAARKDAEEQAEKERDDARKKRHDGGKHDGSHKDCARCDSEEEAEKEPREKDGEFEKKDGKRKDAASKENVDADRGTEDIRGELNDSKATIASLQAQIEQLQRANRPLSIEDRDAIARAFHRADAVCQMLGDSAPHAIPGESPTAYRKRLASALRPYTQSFKNYVFHDAQQPTDFELVEKAILDEATAYAKNPPAESVVGLREVKDTTTLPGKVRTTFIGDARAAWAPFMPPMRRFIRSVNTQPRGAAFR